MGDNEQKQKIASLIHNFLEEIEKIRNTRDCEYRDIIKKIETKKMAQILEEIKKN